MASLQMQHLEPLVLYQVLIVEVMATRMSSPRHFQLPVIVA